MNISRTADRIVGLHVDTNNHDDLQNKVLQMYADLVDSCVDEEDMTSREARSAAAIALIRIAAQAIPKDGRHAALLSVAGPSDLIGGVML